MIRRPNINSFSGRWLILLVPLLALVVWSCSTTKKPKKVIYIEDKNIPKKIAVLPARFLSDEGKRGDLKRGSMKEQGPDIQPETDDKQQFSLQVDPTGEKGIFVAKLMRGVINNQLNGKGYSTQILDKVDRKLGSLKDKAWDKTSPGELCKILGVDGLVYTEIISAVMMKALAYDEYSIEAKIKMVNNRGDTLGTWTESASKRKISIPTSPLSAAAVVLEAVMDESERKHMRLIIYDLGWKITQFIPDSPHKEALPEIISVDTNIDKGIFAAGEQIEVEINAEKGLACTFDLGDFKKDIPIPYKEGGIYQGVYRVREGDKTSMAPIKIRMVKPNGVERVWLETGGAVTIDAIAPPPPENVKASSSRKGVSLSWALPQTVDLNEFVVERGGRPVGDFVVLAKTKDQRFLDTAVTQGSVHYYRVRSKDEIGNRSPPTRAVKVTMPFFDEVKLPDVSKGTLIPGVYLVAMESVIPEGEILDIGPGSRLKFSPGARLTAKGTLKIKGSQDRSVIFTGKDWKGIQVASGGRTEISHASLQDCSPCIEAEGGSLEVKSATLKGMGGDGIIIGQGSRFDLKNLLVGGFDKGIVLKGDKGSILESTITKNRVGVEFVSGAVELAKNNIYGNRENELLSRGKLILYNNYLGAKTVKESKLEGDILVKSLLDAPYPHGRKVVLVDEKDITPEAINARFKEQKGRGIEAFIKRKFGQAHQFLSKAMSLKDDREVYLYLVYTQMNLGEDSQAEKTLERGIGAFPYEVRLYQIYARYLASKGKRDEALALLEKALRMNPDDQGLKIMKEGLEEPAQTVASKEKTKEKKSFPPRKQETEPEKKAPDFQELKSKGIDAFKERKFKEAKTFFTKALSVKDDREVYLYLAYTQMNLGEDSEAEKTLEKGLKVFPEEVRFYRVYAKHLAATGEKKKALSLVEKGLKIAPDDTNLKFMKEYLE